MVVVVCALIVIYCALLYELLLCLCGLDVFVWFVCDLKCGVVWLVYLCLFVCLCVRVCLCVVLYVFVGFVCGLLYGACLCA